MKSQSKNSAEFVKWFGPVLNALRKLGDSGTPLEVSDLVGKLCNVSDKTKEEFTESGIPRFYNQVCWARQYLVWEGLISSEKRGVWQLTEKGKKADLNEKESRELFKKWVQIHAERRKNKEEITPKVSKEEFEVASVLDEEPDLISVLQSMTPNGFERFCKYLLRINGFEKVEVTPIGKDGGIDGFGVLQVNPFVSFKVIFQCKRYVGTVSRAQVGDLRNAMIGRADKGIMITTGIFSEDAKREASRDGAPQIELIDGKQLVEMLIKDEIGVKPKTVYDVDYEFFKTYQVD